MKFDSIHYRENPILIFIHLGHTGGATICNIIEDQYDSDSLFFAQPMYKEICEGELFLNEIKNQLEGKKNNIQCIYGHMYFGVHEIVSHPCTYVTMFREPLEQVMSTYYWRLNYPLKEKLSTKNISLEEFQDKYDNMQTRLILNKLKDSYYERLTWDDLIEAKKIINKYFSFIGITEMFDESVFLMRKIFGWKYMPYYNNSCVNDGRPRRENISKELVERIKNNNKIDYELYYYAKQLMEEKLNAINASERMHMAKFSQNSKKIRENLFKDELSKMPLEVIRFLKLDKEIKILIFGASNGGRITYNNIQFLNNEFECKINVLGFLDNDSDKLGKNIHEKVILKPEKKIIDEADYIIVSSDWKKEILEQLINMEIGREKIIFSY